MRIIIEKDGIKRELETPFNICGNREDLERIHKEIQKSGMKTYGWIRIPKLDIEPSVPDTSPLPWKS